MPVSKKRGRPPTGNAKSGAERQRESVAKRKALRIEQEDLLLEFVESVDSGALGIRCGVSMTPGLGMINFDWTGEQSAYDEMAVRCAEVKLSLAAMIANLEQEYLRKWTAEQKAKVKAQNAADMERVKAEHARAVAELEGLRARAGK